MDFLIQSRASTRARSADDDPELDERHWSYMDPHAATMIARGPTFGPDRKSWTGSVHILGLPDVASVRRFVADEPYQQAGAYERHRIWSFANRLGRTMWQFDADADALRFFVLDPGPPAELDDLDDAVRGRLIVYGALADPDSEAPVGTALALQVTDRAELDAVLAQVTQGPLEIHDWEFGGRR